MKIFKILYSFFIYKNSIITKICVLLYSIMYTGSIFYEIVTDWAEPFVKYYKILLNYPIFSINNLCILSSLKRL